MGDNYLIASTSVPEGLTIRDQTTGPTSLVFPDMFTIYPGAHVELADGVTLDDAAQAFWDAIRRMAPNLVGPVVAEVIRQMARNPRWCPLHGLYTFPNCEAGR